MSHEIGSQPEIPQAELLSLANEQDVTRAIDLMVKGETIGFQTITYGLMGDTSRPSVLETINGSKHRGKLKPIAIAIPDTQWIADMADLTRIDPALHAVITDPKEMSRRISGKMMIKLPVKPGYTINGLELTSHADADEHGPWLLVLHYGDVHKHGQHLTERAYAEGVGLLGVSSMNHTGEPTITERGPAREYAAANGIPIVIADPTEEYSARRGSYLIAALAQPGEVLPMQQRQLKQSIELLRPVANLDAAHVEYNWPEIFGEHERPFAETVGAIAPGFFNLAANRNAGEMLQVAQNLGMLSVNESTKPEPRPPLLRTPRLD